MLLAAFPMGEMLQVFTAIFTFGAAWFGFMAKNHAKKSSEYGRIVEDAVNHRHRHADYDGNHPPPLYDLVVENRAMVKSLEQKLSDNEHANVKLFEELDNLHDAVASHVEWEESVKWDEIAAGLKNRSD